MKTIEQLTAPTTAWYSSNDEENWYGGPYKTRDEAEDEAELAEHRLIMRAKKRPIRVSEFFDVESFFELVEERNEDFINDDGYPILDFLPAVNMDLQCRVKKAIDEWQVEHQLAPEAWPFDSSDTPEEAAWALTITEEEDDSDV